MPHLRLVLPAAAAVVWVFNKLQSRQSKPPAEPPAEQDEGKEVEVEVPSGKGPQLPLAPPSPLKVVLLDATVPLSLAGLWLALFHASSDLLADFHQQMGDQEVTVEPWRRHKDGQRRRLLRYTTPLKNPLGPRQAFNTETFEVVQLTAAGFVLAATCASEGVPFASAFTNSIQWVAMPAGPHACRLVVTGECRFHSPVWGPLKGTIERESVKGMQKAYRIFLRMLEARFGGAKTAAPKAAAAGATATAEKLPAGKQGQQPVAVTADASAGAATTAAAAAGGAAGESTNIAALLANPHTNAAAFLAMIVVMVLIWRLAFMQPMLLQAARNMASAVARH